MKILLLIGYMLGVSNPPNEYAECHLWIIEGKRQFVCSVWYNHKWINIYKRHDKDILNDYD